MTRLRVAITGIGLVTPVGNDVATTWSALDGVKNGAASITLFDAAGFPTRIAAEVKGFNERVITAQRKLLNYANRSHRFALAAAEEAMRDSGIAPTDADGTLRTRLKYVLTLTPAGWRIVSAQNTAIMPAPPR